MATAVSGLCQTNCLGQIFPPDGLMERQCGLPGGRSLEAEKLILMTNVPGVRDREGKLVYVLAAADADGFLRDGVVEGGMRPRVTAALHAVREGVRSVHIIDGGVPSALLLEVLTAEGVGTALRSDAGADFLEDSRDYLMAE